MPIISFRLGSDGNCGFLGLLYYKLWTVPMPFFCCGSLLHILVSVSVTFHLGIAEWPPFGKEQLIRLIICSLCIMFIYY